MTEALKPVFLELTSLGSPFVTAVFDQGEYLRIITPLEFGRLKKNLTLFLIDDAGELILTDSHEIYANLDDEYGVSQDLIYHLGEEEGLNCIECGYYVDPNEAALSELITRFIRVTIRLLHSIEGPRLALAIDPTLLGDGFRVEVEPLYFVSSDIATQYQKEGEIALLPPSVSLDEDGFIQLYGAECLDRIILHLGVNGLALEAEIRDESEVLMRLPIQADDESGTYVIEGFPKMYFDQVSIIQVG